ncbi:MAG: hypothetical protein MI861_26900 [Pirellulales bacterium]|nr:hypothetical protein [Pirellulales bacterium]
MTAQSLSPATCCILVPVQHSIEPGCERSLIRLESAGFPVRRVTGYSQIDVGRNAMASAALRDGFEETMWIDSDIEFLPEDVMRLRSHNLPICCGIYPKKGKRELACHVMPGTAQMQFGHVGGLAEILYAAAGFLHVRRHVYLEIQQRLNLETCDEQFGAPVIPFFQPLVRKTPDGNWYLGEDYAFCERARQAGFKIMADTRIRLRHMGMYGYSWEDAGSELERYANFNLRLNE